MIIISMEDGQAGVETSGSRKEILETLLGLVKSDVVTPEFADKVLKLINKHEHQEAREEKKKRKKK